MTLSVFAAAVLVPRAEALVCDGHRLTFAELAERTATRLPILRELGHGPVGIVVDGSLVMFELLYAAFALGVPVLPLHPRLTTPERDQLLALAKAGTVLDPAQLDPSAALLAPRPADRLLPEVPEERALVLVPSSGSTGTPKLVELSRRAFVALTHADATHVAPHADDRALLCLPLSHVGGLSLVIRALAARRSVVAFRAGARGLLGSLPDLGRALIEERISLVSLVPPVLARLLRECPRIAQESPLRAVLLGGQACSEALYEEARAQGVPVLTSYGLTEACSQVSTSAFPPAVRAPIERGVVGVGFPLTGVELRVSDGLIELRGPTLFTRYVGQPAPFAADGFFSTGDRGLFDAERGLFVFGRDSELIITGGENVDPIEVEHALLACGPLSAACVFGIPDSEFGACVVAVLEVAEGAVLDEPALFAALDRRLASFKQPRRVCVLEALPRLASGKLDRPRIRASAHAQLRATRRSSASDFAARH